VIIHKFQDKNVRVKKNEAKIQYIILFFLNSFLVNKNLIQKTAKSITSINIKEENTKFTTFHIKSFMSFKLIQRELKNITSSTF
jgi:hypothetical protein